MMGSAATKAAERERYTKALHDIAIEKAQFKIDAAKAKLDAKLNRYDTKTDVAGTANSIAALRAQTESQTLILPVQGQVQADSADSATRAAIVKAIPWVIGGVVAVAAIMFLRKGAKS